MRGGRAVKISIFDIVVGDVVPLKIGDQVRVLLILGFLYYAIVFLNCLNPTVSFT